ncbi:type II toxin-antitoxin system RelE/ParE family toxin [Streptomyces sp. NPDC008139]|uniref:type II toxin-antitoxin system RelE family toxin n=1 Tax=Streptomyces sp. NPDC008139 TaxID=3364814 RepID=UPI0036E85763
MKYALRFTVSAQRQLRAIDRTAAMTILTALTPLGDDPYRADVNVKKHTGRHDLYRLRVGDFRIAYQVDDGQLVVLVVRVGHRRDVYRNL